MDWPTQASFDADFDSLGATNGGDASFDADFGDDTRKGLGAATAFEETDDVDAGFETSFAEAGDPPSPSRRSG